jgi:hypothetical protein
MKLKHIWSLIIAGLFFLGLYVAIAVLQRNFMLTSLNYANNVSSYMKWIPTPWFQSQIWKIMFLLPAILLFSVALVRAGIPIPIPQAIPYRRGIACVLAVVAVLLVVSVSYLFHETEITDDENAYDFQAQTLLAGRIVNPPPPVAASFDNVFLINDGHSWVGKYTLGHPIVLAFGMMLGSRYIGTIIECLLTLLLVYFIADELYHNKRLAFVAMGLGAVSPFFYFMSSTRLSHTTTAFFLALFIYLFLRARRTETNGWKWLLFLLAGLSIGYAFNTRSLTALGFCLPFGIVLAKDIWRFPPKGMMNGLAISIGFMIIFAVTMWYNFLVTGNCLRFPFHYYDSSEAIGFGIYDHTPLLSIQNLAVNCFRLNAALFGFPVSFIFVFIILFTKTDFGDRLMFGILAGVAGLYSLYYSPGISDFGPVYYYEMIIPLLLLSARGIFCSIEFLSRYSPQGKPFVATFLVVSCVAAWATYVPEKIIHINRLTEQIREPYELVRSSTIHHAVVMIEQLPNKGWVFGYRNSSPQFTDDIVYCQYADKASNSATAKYFYDRNLFVLKYDAKKESSQLFPMLRDTL